MKTTKEYALVFIAAFILNVLWEFSHAALYTQYQGAAITEFILIRAAFFDAIVTTLAVYFFFGILGLRYAFTATVVVLFIFAIGLELWALESGRWAYREAMPIIPFFETGLTPTIQLALLGFISIFFSQRIAKNYETR